MFLSISRAIRVLSKFQMCFFATGVASCACFVGVVREMRTRRVFSLARVGVAAVVSRFTSENDMARAMLFVAQRWCGASTPVNMLHAGDLRLLRPLGASAPQAAHMPHELPRQHKMEMYKK